MRAKKLVLPVVLLLLSATMANAAELRIENKSNRWLRLKFTHDRGSATVNVGPGQRARLQNLRYYGERVLIGSNSSGKVMFRKATTFRKDKRVTIRRKNGDWDVDFMGL